MTPDHPPFMMRNQQPWHVNGEPVELWFFDGKQLQPRRADSSELVGEVRY